MRFIIAVLLIVFMSVSWADKRHRNDDDDGDDDDGFVIQPSKAKQFLNRKKRHLVHECYREGCDFEEVEEHTTSRESALEYWYRYRCSKFRQYCYNGDWRSWSSWEQCTASCSNSANNGGIQRRHRTCGSLWPLQCRGLSVEWRPCSPRPADCDECLKYNGGCEQICVNTKGSHRCECKAQFYLANDKKTCRSCPAYILPRCLLAVCDEGGSNVHCIQCQGVLDCEGKSFQTYRAVNGRCEELCSWKYNWCYPGRCSTGPTSCQCLEGFSGPRCQKIDKKPSLESCTVRAVGKGSHYQTASCDLPLVTKYLNFTPSAFDITFKTLLGVDLTTKVVDQDVPYILDAQIGLTSAMISVHKLNSKGLPVTSLNYEALNCSVHLSSSKPHPGPVTCHLRVEASNLGEMAEGESIKVSIQVISGGFITILNPESVTNFTEYYIPSNITQSALLGLDFSPPDHCSITRNCSIPLIDITPSSIRSGHLLFELNGWEDSMNSETELQYSYALFELAETDTGEMEEMLFPLTKGNTRQVHLDLNSFPVISSFSLVLSVFDQSLNERRVRAVILRSKPEKILINPDKPIKVTSADKDTGFFWQKSLTEIKAVWNRHFYIESNPPANTLTYDGVEDSYDFRFEGEPKDVSGGNRLTYAYALTLGKNASQPPYDKFNSNVKHPRNSVKIPVSLRNGDVVTIWIKAVNTLDQILVDHAQVHVDVSPPIIDKVKLIRVNNDLFSIENTLDTIHFQLLVDAWDPQSGIQEIAWSLGESRDSDKLGYEKNIVNQDMGFSPPETSCVLTASICPRLSLKYSIDNMKELQKDDGKGLIFTILATNHAGMTSLYYYKVGDEIKPGKSQAQVGEK